MTYAFIQDVPANEEIYGQIREKLPSEPPEGLIAHVVIKRDGGLRYVDVWESEADWDRFRWEQVEPLVAEVLSSHGLPHDHSLVTIDQIDVVETWLGVSEGSLIPG